MTSEVHHYVVILKWRMDLEEGFSVLAVEHSEDKARTVFKERLVSERAFAEEKGFKIYADEDLNFDAGLSGFYAEGHSHLYVQKV